MTHRDVFQSAGYRPAGLWDAGSTPAVANRHALHNETLRGAHAGAEKMRMATGTVVRTTGVPWRLVLDFEGGGGEMAKKKWNRSAFYLLLRYGQKEDGGWSEPELFLDEKGEHTGETIPDDDDLDLLMAAPDMREAIEKAVSDCVRGYDGSIQTSDEAFEMLRAALRKAKGLD